MVNEKRANDCTSPKISQASGEDQCIQIFYKVVLNVKTTARTRRRRVINWIGVEEEKFDRGGGTSLSQYCSVEQSTVRVEWEREGGSEDELGGLRSSGSWWSLELC